MAKRPAARRELIRSRCPLLLEDWKFSIELGRTYGGAVPPLETFLIRMLKFSEILNSSDLTPAHLAAKMREVNAVADEAWRQATEYTKQKSEE